MLCLGCNISPFVMIFLWKLKLKNFNLKFAGLEGSCSPSSSSYAHVHGGSCPDYIVVHPGRQRKRGFIGSHGSGGEKGCNKMSQGDALKALGHVDLRDLYIRVIMIILDYKISMSQFYTAAHYYSASQDCPATALPDTGFPRLVFIVHPVCSSSM